MKPFLQYLSTIGLTLIRFLRGGPTSPAPNFDYIHSWAAIGDSYASGLGAGLREDYACSRYAGGYPGIINLDSRFSGSEGAANPNRTAQFLACSGRTSLQVLQKQVPKLNRGLDLILLSAGGNDVQLGEVLDSCIFQWRRGGNTKCEASLNSSQLLIDTALVPNLLQLLNATLDALAPDGTIYVTGYAQFFGMAPECDNVTWSVWPQMPDNDRQFLSRDRRVRMNGMVAQVNGRLVEAISAINLADKPRTPAENASYRDRVKFINWDWTFGQVNGRFCESGVVEPDPMRKGLLFYEWNTLDDGDDPAIVQRPGDPVPKDTFEGNISIWVAETLEQHPGWTFRGPGAREGQELDFTKAYIEEHALREEEWILDHPELLRMPKGKNGQLRAAMGLDDFIFWFLPDSWKRVFHPRALGHRIIADIILHEMAVDRAKALGLSPPPWPNYLGTPPLEMRNGLQEDDELKIEL